MVGRQSLDLGPGSRILAYFFTSKGVDMTGKIAIVRYGGNFRGLKIKAAQEAGAAGGSANKHSPIYCK